MTFASRYKSWNRPTVGMLEPERRRSACAVNKQRVSN